MKRIIVLVGLVFSLSVVAQEKVYVNAFKNKQLINAQTAVIPEGFDFTIMHRFGKIGLDDRVYKDFLGFDNPFELEIRHPFIKKKRCRIHWTSLS